MNLPPYDFLSAPLGIITLLHIITLGLHFAAMNFIVGGVIIVLWGRFTGAPEHPVVQRFIALFPAAMATTVTFGVAPLLFVQLVYPEQVYAAAIVGGWFWISIPVAVIVAYSMLYAARFAEPGDGRRRRYLGIALVAMAYVSIVYTAVFALAERPVLMQSLYAADQSGLSLNPEVMTYAFRWLHMILGAVTVGGFCVGVVGRDNEDAWRVGRRFFGFGMLAASIVGIIFLFTLGDMLKPFMRSSGIYYLTVGIVLALGSLHLFFKRRLLTSGSLLFVSLLTMVASRHVLRDLRLAESYDPAALTVSPQWGLFALFVVFFVIAIAVTVYMLRLFFVSGVAEAAER